MCCCRGCHCLKPLQGALGLITHPTLLCEVVVPCLLVLVVAICSLVFLFRYSFEKQGQVLEGFGCPAWLVGFPTTMLIFLEVSAPTLLLGMICFHPLLYRITYDVLVQHGVTQRLKSAFDLAEIPEVIGGEGFFMVTTKLVFVMLQLALMVVTLPLNAFPVFGVVLWFAINGWFYTWHLLGYLLPVFGCPDVCSQCVYAWENKLELISFGVVALALTFIPWIGPFFLFSNAFGAALLFESLVDEQGSRIMRENYVPAEDSTALAEASRASPQSICVVDPRSAERMEILSDASCWLHWILCVVLFFVLLGEIAWVVLTRTSQVGTA